MTEQCELCDMPLAFCPHGQPPPPPAPEPAPKAPRAPRTAKPRTPATKPTVTSTPKRRRWTTPETLVPVILDALAEHGGALGTDAALDAVEAAMGERFQPGDHERTPTGELRWHLAARRARQQLITEGRMTKEQPGVWTLA
jgi:hypothetical protein